MFLLLAIMLIGVNIAPFLFAKLDFWHAQGFWVQSCILVMFCFSIFLRPRNKRLNNLPLGIFTLWVGLNTAFFCFLSQMKGKYDVSHFFPFFNILCLVILYKMIVDYLTYIEISRLVMVLRYVIIFTMFMCVLQYFGLSQFFALVEPNNNYHNNPVVGFIANPTHLSGFLGMMVPIFLIRRVREDYLALILMALILCFMTGTTKGDVAISGIIVAIVVTGFYLFFTERIKAYWFGGSVIVLSIIGLLFLPHHTIERLLADNGRIGWFLYYWDYFKQMPFTGTGLGFINQFYKHSEYPLMRHLHMEYFQLAFELGIIALILFGWMIKNFFELKKKNNFEFISLQAVVLGFLVSCCFNYPAHLWLPATYALFAYASVYAMNGEV